MTGLIIPSHYSVKVEEESGKILLYLKTNSSFYYNLSHDLELVGSFDCLEQLVEKVKDVRYQNISKEA